MKDIKTMTAEELKAHVLNNDIKDLYPNRITPPDDHSDEQGPSHALDAFQAIADLIKSTRRIDLTRPSTYHLLFNLNNKIRVFVVRPTSGRLNNRIKQFADLILVNPAPKLFMKDRHGLKDFARCHTEEQVLQYIEEQKQIWRDDNAPRSFEDE